MLEEAKGYFINTVDNWLLSISDWFSRACFDEANVSCSAGRNIQDICMGQFRRDFEKCSTLELQAVNEWNSSRSIEGTLLALCDLHMTATLVAKSQIIAIDNDFRGYWSAKFGLSRRMRTFHLPTLYVGQVSSEHLPCGIIRMAMDKRPVSNHWLLSWMIVVEQRQCPSETGWQQTQTALISHHIHWDTWLIRLNTLNAPHDWFVSKKRLLNWFCDEYESVMTCTIVQFTL
jgi:hypothetical protein